MYAVKAVVSICIVPNLYQMMAVMCLCCETTGLSVHENFRGIDLVNTSLLS